MVNKQKEDMEKVKKTMYEQNEYIKKEIEDLKPKKKLKSNSGVDI